MYQNHWQFCADLIQILIEKPEVISPKKPIRSFPLVKFLTCQFFDSERKAKPAIGHFP
jgi:hypothetical protein